MGYIQSEGPVMFEKISAKFEEVGLADLTNKVSDSAVFVLREYEQKIALLLNAVVDFLREIRIAVPGYEEKLSGLEVYQKFSNFVADVTADAITKVPEILTAYSNMIGDLIAQIRVPILVFGEEEIEVAMITFEEFQMKLTDIVQSIGAMSLEDIVAKFTEFNEVVLQVFYERASDVATDALTYINTQVQKLNRMVERSSSYMVAKVQELISDEFVDQLTADIQSWVDSTLKSLNAFQNKIIEFLKDITQKLDSIVRVYDKRIEIDIALPFADEQ